MKTKSQQETSQRFSEVFSDPLGRRFPSQRLSVLLPLIDLSLNLSPNSLPGVGFRNFAGSIARQALTGINDLFQSFSGFLFLDDNTILEAG